jgi:hypothetical protein
MSFVVPVVNLADPEPGTMRAASEELGVIQVVNHGVPGDLIADFDQRMERLLSLPRADKAKLASPHPYRGWRQWPDDFGRLELERFNVAQFDTIGDARATGLGDEYLGLFAHANMWPDDDPALRDVAFAFGLGELPHYRLTVNDYPVWTYPETGPGGTGSWRAARRPGVRPRCSSIRRWTPWSRRSSRSGRPRTTPASSPSWCGTTSRTGWRITWRSSGVRTR